MNTENQKTLGYIFGYKQTSSVTDDNNTQIKVNFISGTSEKYPLEYSSNKDFWFEEIFENQSSDIYIEPSEFKTFFLKEYKEFIDGISEENSFHRNILEQRKKLFSFPINDEQFAALYSFSIIDSLMFQLKWENDSVLYNTLKDNLGHLFKDSNIPLNVIYEEYLKISDYIYNNDLESLKSTISLKF